MGSGGSAVDAMVIGCLGVERRAERFFSYLAIWGDLFFRKIRLIELKKLISCLCFKKKHEKNKKRLPMRWAEGAVLLACQGHGR